MMNNFLSIGIIHLSASLYQQLSVNNLFHYRGLHALWGSGVENVGGGRRVVVVKLHGDEFGGGGTVGLKISYAWGKGGGNVAEEAVEREVVLVATKGVDGAILRRFDAHGGATKVGLGGTRWRRLLKTGSRHSVCLSPQGAFRQVRWRLRVFGCHCSGAASVCWRYTLVHTPRSQWVP